MEKSNKGLKIALTIISCLTSFAMAGYSVFVLLGKNNWFIGIAAYFVFETLMTFIASLIKDEYKGMRVLGVMQIIGVIFMMDYLLFMALWRSPQYIHPLNAYIAYGTGAFIKFILWIIEAVSTRKHYSPLIHGYRNSDFITFSYLVLIIVYVVFYQLFPEREVALWVFIVQLSINAVFTIVSAILAVFTDVRAKTRQPLTTKDKFKHVATWIYDNEVTLFLGFVATIYTSVIAFNNIKKSNIYLFLILFYLGTMLIKLIDYLWHKGIQKSSKGNKIKENRRSSWILLFNALFYTLFSDIICFGAIVLMLNKIEVSSDIYLFLFVTIPLCIFRFIAAGRGINKSRNTGDTYRLGLGYISLIAAFFNLLETVAIGSYNANIVLKYLIVISTVVVLKIVVIIVVLIFLVHAIRSLVVNRKSKERQQEEMEQVQEPEKVEQ